MKEKLTILVTAMLLALSLGLSGCMTTGTGSHRMMDNSMSTQTQSMEKSTMHHETMNGTMETKKHEKMDNTMAAPMGNSMQNGDTQSDMSGAMK